MQYLALIIIIRGNYNYITIIQKIGKETNFLVKIDAEISAEFKSRIELEYFKIKLKLHGF